MRIALLDDVQIPENRQRREFPEVDLIDLANSIAGKRLIHAPVFRLTEKGGLELVAGERRLRAITRLAAAGTSFKYEETLIPPGQIPYTLISELDALTLKEIELEENVIRRDLPWQDYVAATAELDALRAAQAALRGETHTLRDTASEIAGKRAEGSEITKVSDALLVAKHLDDPEVQKAKNTKQALKVIRQKAEAAHRAVLAEQFDLTQTPHTLINADARDFAAGLSDGICDVILTDPPYGVEADNFGSMASVRHEYEDSWEYAHALYKMIAVQGYRITKPQAHAYVFCDIRFFDKIAFEFTLAGWEVWPTPMFWNKLNGMLPRPEHGPRRTYEAILYAIKGGKPVVRVGSDVLTYPQVMNKTHGAQKPVALYTDLLSRSVVPGNTVIDFCVGSGTIFPAANQLKLVAWGCERVEAYYHDAVTRLNSKEDVLDISSLGAGA